MLKKIGFALLFAVYITSPSAYAIGTHVLQPGISIDYDLPPNDPQDLVNYMFWTIDATCVMITPDSSDDLYAIALEKKGKINNIVLKKGESMHLSVHNNDVLKISAESGAKVRIVNNGAHTVKAKCSA